MHDKKPTPPPDYELVTLNTRHAELFSRFCAQRSLKDLNVFLQRTLPVNEPRVGAL